MVEEYHIYKGTNDSNLKLDAGQQESPYCLSKITDL